MLISSRATDYALLLLIHLAKLPHDVGSSVKKASEALHISLRFLANIANKLTIARILLSHRGLGGGIRLAKPSRDISILEVIEAVDGPVKTMFCQNTTEDCSHEPDCSMKFFWDDVQSTVIDKLSETSIADLVTKTSGGGTKQINQQASMEV